MARTKQTARRSVGGAEPRRHLAERAARREATGRMGQNRQPVVKTAVKGHTIFEINDDSKPAGTPKEIKKCPVEVYRAFVVEIKLAGDVRDDFTVRNSRIPLLVTVYPEENNKARWSALVHLPTKDDAEAMPHLIHWDNHGLATAVQFEGDTFPAWERLSAFNEAFENAGQGSCYAAKDAMVTYMQVAIPQKWQESSTAGSTPKTYTGVVERECELRPLFKKDMPVAVNISGNPMLFGLVFREDKDTVWWEILMPAEDVAATFQDHVDSRGNLLTPKYRSAGMFIPSTFPLALKRQMKVPTFSISGDMVTATSHLALYLSPPSIAPLAQGQVRQELQEPVDEDEEKDEEDEEEDEEDNGSDKITPVKEQQPKVTGASESSATADSMAKFLESPSTPRFSVSSLVAGGSSPARKPPSASDSESQSTPSSVEDDGSDNITPVKEGRKRKRPSPGRPKTGALKETTPQRRSSRPPKPKRRLPE